MDTAQEKRLDPSRSGSASAAPAQVAVAISGLRRAVREFLLLPGVVTICCAALGVLSIVLDKSPPTWLRPEQHALAGFISPAAASALLSGIATSVVTVTSITFSVLLLAVQQTASSMTPAVFDQFLRRRTNQLYLGMFVGLSVYSFLVLSSLGPKATPALGAALALLLTLVAFAVLIVLIYSTVDQMRPTSVTQVLHDQALKARVAESELLKRTRRSSRGHGSVRVSVHAEQDGYVTGLDLDGIARAMPDAHSAEVILRVTVGDNVAFAQPIATVIDDDEARSRRTAESVRRAIVLGRQREIDRDASFCVEELGTIAWTTLSTAKHNPQTGRVVVDRLRDLGARWGIDNCENPLDGGELPIVYDDRDLTALLDTLLALVVVCAESQQLESSAHVVNALADVLRTAPEHEIAGVRPALIRTLTAVGVHPLNRSLERALERLVDALRERGEHEVAERVGAIHLAKVLPERVAYLTEDGQEARERVSQGSDG